MSAASLPPHVRRALTEAVLDTPSGLKHWVDVVADWLEGELRSRSVEEHVFNGGLSVSGLQHVGRLRGEVIIPDVLASILRGRGLKVRQKLTLYTQDAWKGKESQLRQFSDPEEARRYVGWPLHAVPDPRGCHRSWVEHYWEDFGPYIPEFTRGDVEVVTTTELYRGPLLEFAREVFERREEVRRVINKYRGRKPYPPGWIPFEPRCTSCGRIDSTEALEVDWGEGRARFRCSNCGAEDWSPLSEGKLNWRIEWAGVWKVLGVTFEPYGKDHATPGGSRDSAAELARLLGYEPPAGLPYEWVAVRHPDGRIEDMSSSDFIGFTPREWLEVAEPEVLRFLYLRTPPMRKIVLGLHEVPQYYQQYYKAERVYFGAEEVRDERERVLLARSYELSYARREPPERMPAQPPYTHVAILAQILPPSTWPWEPLRRLQRTGHMPENPSDFDVERLRRLLPRARRWAEKYAPEQMRFRVQSEVSEEAAKAIPRDVAGRLAELASKLESLSEWSEEAIKEALIRFTEGWSSGDRRRFYQALYLALIGKPQGPRAAPLLSLMDRSVVVKLLREAAEKAGGR